jgi:hypothetical protein
MIPREEVDAEAALERLAWLASSAKMSLLDLTWRDKGGPKEQPRPRGRLGSPRLQELRGQRRGPAGPRRDERRAETVDRRLPGPHPFGTSRCRRWGRPRHVLRHSAQAEHCVTGPRGGRHGGVCGTHRVAPRGGSRRRPPVGLRPADHDEPAGLQSRPTEPERVSAWQRGLLVCAQAAAASRAEQDHRVPCFTFRETIYSSLRCSRV